MFGRGRARVGRRDRGMVTAELALAVPVVVMVLALGLAAIRVGVDQVRCVDAARLAANPEYQAEMRAVREELDELRAW